MKILVICPTVFKLPLTGYGGTEQICTELATHCALAEHTVTMVAPEGSELPDGVELLEVPLRCSEEVAFNIFKDKLADYDIISDHSFEGWAYMESIGYDPSLPIVHTCHTDPYIWGSPPPVPHPCIVGISQNHARRLSLAYQVPVRCVYDGIDTSFYRPPVTEKKRGGRYLWLGRYTAEKDPLTAIQMAKRLRIPLDLYGDTEIVASQEYVERCRQEADGILIRWYPGVTREETVNLYQTYKALIYTPAWDEPFGLILAEAQACGMPVLTLAHGSLSELVKDGVSGYVRDDIRGLEKVIQDGCLASIQSDDCVTMGKTFSRELMGEGYLDLFEQVRAGHPW